MTMDPVTHRLVFDTPAQPATPKPHIRRYYAGATFGWVWGLYPDRQSLTPTLWTCSLPALTGYLSIPQPPRAYL